MVEPPRVVAIDFSAAAVPRHGADSLWLAWADPESPILTRNPRTRSELAELVARLCDHAGTTLVFMDIALGWPAGMAAALGLRGRPHVATGALIDSLLVEGEDNANNRFAVADELNRRSGCALFWGHPPSMRFRWLSMTTQRPRGLAPAPFPAKRILERDVGGVIKSPLQLSGAGAVGSQSLVGQSWVRTLRRQGLPLAIWPFEDPGRVTFVEQFFSLSQWRPDRERGAVRDQRQVTAVVRGARRRLAAGEEFCSDEQLAALTARDRRAVHREEGWLAGYRARGDSLRRDRGGRYGGTERR